VAVKVTPVTLPPLTVTVCEVGVKLTRFLLGVTVYVPFCTLEKVKLPEVSAVTVAIIFVPCKRVMVAPDPKDPGVIEPETA
jgi:hypothetical protein